MIKRVIILFIIISPNILFSQMQKLYSEDSLNTFFFGFNLAITGNYVIVGEKNQYKNSNLSVFKKKNEVWVHHSKRENINIPQYYSYDSYNRERMILGYEKDNEIFIYKLSDDGIINLRDTVGFPIDDNYTGGSVNVYNNWIIRVISYFNPEDFKSYQRYLFYHYENDSWVLKNEFNDYYNFTGSVIWLVSINDRFAAFGYPAMYFKGNRNGGVVIFENKGSSWERYQQIFQPDPMTTNSGFGSKVFISPDSKYLGISAYRDSLHYGEYSQSLYIYKLVDDKYEFMQKLSKFTTGRVARYQTSFNICNDELLIGAPFRYGNKNSPKEYRYKGAIDYYKLKGGKWSFVSEIKPSTKSDTLYRKFGWGIIREGETVITNALRDYTVYKHPIKVSNGAAYVFQIPARDTLRVSMCEGESYTFNDTTIMTSGHYVDTLRASYGVDSVVQLYVDVMPRYEESIDTVLCEGEELEIGGDFYSETGEYNIVLQSEFGCDSIINLKIEKSYVDTSNVYILPDYGCDNGEISLEIDNNKTKFAFNWSNGLTEQDISGLSSGNYTLSVSDSNCKYEYEFSVPDSLAYLIPNLFFPDGDEEQNQIFKPYLAREVELLSTEIFDRWGNKVFNSEGNEFWDGTSKGVKLPPGVYLYKMIIKSPCGVKPRIGQITLLR